MGTGVDKELVTQLISDQAGQKSVLGLVETRRRAWSTGQAFWKMVVRMPERVQRGVDLVASVELSRCRESWVGVIKAFWWPELRGSRYPGESGLSGKLSRLGARGLGEWGCQGWRKSTCQIMVD